AWEGLAERETVNWCAWLQMPFFFFQAEDGIRYRNVTGVQTCALPILPSVPLACSSFPFAPEIHTCQSDIRTPQRRVTRQDASGRWKGGVADGGAVDETGS